MLPRLPNRTNRNDFRELLRQLLDHGFKIRVQQVRQVLAGKQALEEITGELALVLLERLSNV
jgi:hypothetical protein